MLPSALLQVLVAPLVPALERTFGHRAPLLEGLLLVLAGSVALAFWHAEWGASVRVGKALRCAESCSPRPDVEWLFSRAWANTPWEPGDGEGT